MPDSNAPAAEVVGSSATNQVEAWLREFAAALDRCDIQALKELFAPECHWRDLVAFTWNIKTMEGRESIGKMVGTVLDGVKPRNWVLQGDTSESDGVVEAWLKFETEAAHCVAHVRLRNKSCWTLLTAAEELKGYGELRGPTREMGAPHGSAKERASCDEPPLKKIRKAQAEPYVVIIGGSQSGIVLGARLKRLGVPTIILEKSARAGDHWRNRYEALHLHDPVWATHLPYIPFPDHWPIYPNKDDLADWLEMYVHVMKLDYWTGSTCTSAVWDKLDKEWTVEVNCKGDQVVLKPKHIVLATGVYGLPNIPKFPGMSDFGGDLMHSSKYNDAAAYDGKRVVVIGSNTSAHDICANLWEHGAEVTMVQRSSTCVVGRQTLREILCADYSEEALARGLTCDKADMKFASLPFRVMTDTMKSVCLKMRERDSELLRGLERAGFRLDFGEDDSGNFMKYIRHGTGYYFNCGASELIVDGSVKLVRGAVARISDAGVVMESGAELPADAIMLATGYGPMNDHVAQFLGKAVAEKLGKVWGIGSGVRGDPGPWEGELRNMWKPTRQEGLWVHGGNLQQNRIYSKCLALQLKARQVGLPTPVFGMN
jgi:putative flavoprotein involved in K+ transport